MLQDPPLAQQRQIQADPGQGSGLGGHEINQGTGWQAVGHHRLAGLALEPDLVDLVIEVDADLNLGHTAGLLKLEACLHLIAIFKLLSHAETELHRRVAPVAESQHPILLVHVTPKSSVALQHAAVVKDQPHQQTRSAADQVLTVEEVHAPPAEAHL